MVSPRSCGHAHGTQWKGAFFTFSPNTPPHDLVLSFLRSWVLLTPEITQLCIPPSGQHLPPFPPKAAPWRPLQ